MKLFREEHKLLTLFRTCTRQFRIKSDQKSFHFIKLIDMLNFKNSIWWLIRTRTLNYDMLYFYIDKILNLFSYICLNLMFVCKRLWKNRFKFIYISNSPKIASFAKCLTKVMLKIALDLFCISLNFNFTFNTLRFGKSLEHLQQWVLIFCKHLSTQLYLLSVLNYTMLSNIQFKRYNFNLFTHAYFTVPEV